MELRHLRYFIEVAKQEHMTKAAKVLGIQQPPLSQQIQSLEKELGLALFTRKARGIKLTAAGKLFLSEAHEILDKVDSAINRVKKFDLGEEGSLIVGFTSSASLHSMTPKIVKNFRKQFPLVNLMIKEGSAHDLLRELEEERIDISFSRSPVLAYTGIDCIELLTEEMVLALPLDHPLADLPEQSIQLSHLHNENFILYQQINGSGIKEKIIDDCRQAGFEPRVIETVYRTIGAIHLVAAGMGISIVPKSLSMIQMDNVLYRTFHPSHQLSVPLNIAFRSNSQKLLIQKFIQFAKESSQLE